MLKLDDSRRFVVCRDRREQLGWNFPASDRCVGTQDATLKTGDYTLSGLENVFTLERKRNAAEMATCLFQPRFHRELDRLDAFEHAYLFLEFTLEEVCSFPVGSGIPKSKWGTLRVTPQLFLMKLHEMQLNHPTLRVWFVGTRGRETASSLFKRIVERYAP